MRRKATLIFSVIGMLIAVYLTYLHFSSSACPVNSVSCASLIQGSYSEVLGIPVSLLGFITFAAIFFLAYFNNARLNYIILLGIAAAAYFNSVMYRLSEFCIFCEAAHLTMVSLYFINIKNQLNYYLLFALAIIAGLLLSAIVF